MDIHPLDRAIAELRGQLARTPDDATLHGRLGALHYRRGDLAEAEACYRHALKLQPHRPSFHNNLANVLCDRGAWREGLACYEHALALEKAAAPGREPSPEAVTNLELARLEFRLIHERIEYLERAVQLEVDSAEALNALGGGYLLHNERERALAAFRRAARLDPRNRNAVCNIGFAHTLDLTGSEDLQEVLAELAECAVRFPTEPRVFIHQGELLELAGLLEEAEAQYVRVLRADPRCLEAYDLLGRLRELAGTAGARDETARAAEGALDRLERAARAHRNQEGAAAGAQPLYDLAFISVARARFARKALHEAANVDALLREASRAAVGGEGRATSPAHPSTGEGARGSPHPSTGEGAPGGTPSSRGSPLPSPAAGVMAAVLRAQLLEGDGRRDEAALILETATGHFPRAARLWFERGGLCFRLGEVDHALEAFERATLAEPQEAYTYHSLRFAFEGYRRYRTEQVRYNSAIRANPRDAAAHHRLGLAALAVLKDLEALDHFARALELDPRLAEAAAGRARVLQRQGHLAEAVAAAKQAVEIDPECLEARRALQALTNLQPQLALYPSRGPSGTAGRS